MKKLIASLTLALSLLTYADCPQIDPKITDPDGMPLCPDKVNQVSAFVVFSCAMNQAKSFHAPTKPEKGFIDDLLAAHKAADVKKLMSTAGSLNLQMCRAKNDGKSTLLAYTKPGVTDYSGPFMMMKEGVHSKVILIGPHDDSDGTYADTKKAVVDSDAMLLFSNGHKRGNVGADKGDFVHEGPGENLGAYAVQQMGAMYKGYVWLQIHGWANATKVLYRGRTESMNKAFEAAIEKETKLKEFGNLNADFSVDSLVNTNYYIKTEMPTKLHEGNQAALGKIIVDIEQNAWAK